ncbi:BEL1-like homeodomain 6 [Striga asiatica]|uniref:BEL1-like homeodomain 6 n=1 Tax=Striga asiatica TaxID=4170 RepID=A0A5A7Q2C7_STRAF|nr:BEL1-like homeodomain 6 [Striga asiatica]
MSPQNKPTQLRRIRKRRLFHHWKPIMPRHPQRVHNSPNPLDSCKSYKRARTNVPRRQVSHVRLRVRLHVRKPLHLDNLVVNAFIETIGHGFRDQEDEHHEWEHEEVVGELEEDDAEGDGHAHGAAEEGGGAEEGEEARVEAGDGAGEAAGEAAVGGAGEDDGDEEAGGDGNAVGEDAEGEDGEEEGEEGGDVELVAVAGAEEVADGVVVGVEEEGGEVVVVAGGALEVLVVARAADGGALLAGGQVGGARGARGKPREAVRAAGRQEGDDDHEADLESTASPGNRFFFFWFRQKKILFRFDLIEGMRTSLLVDEAVSPEDLVDEIIVEAAEKATEDPNDYDREQAGTVEFTSNMIKPPWPKSPHFPLRQKLMRDLKTTATTAVVKKALQRSALRHL